MSSPKVFVILAQCYNEIAQKVPVSKSSGIQHTIVTPDEELHSLIYEMLFYVHIYRSHRLLKWLIFFGSPCIYHRP